MGRDDDPPRDQPHAEHRREPPAVPANPLVVHGRTECAHPDQAGDADGTARALKLVGQFGGDLGLDRDETTGRERFFLTLSFQGNRRLANVSAQQQPMQKSPCRRPRSNPPLTPRR